MHFEADLLAKAEGMISQFREGFADLPDRTRDYMIQRIPLIVAQNPVLLDDAAGMLRPGSAAKRSFRG